MIRSSRTKKIEKSRFSADLYYCNDSVSSLFPVGTVTLGGFKSCPTTHDFVEALITQYTEDKEHSPFDLNDNVERVVKAQVKMTKLACVAVLTKNGPRETVKCMFSVLNIRPAQ